MITYAQFIANFPEFNASATYPQSQINFWIGMAYDNLSQRRFKTAVAPGNTLSQLDLAACLYTAHNVTLEAREQRSANAGQIPGTMTGPTAAKAVDKVSISYSDSASDKEAGPYNLTTYGARLYRMFKSVGGAMYVPSRRGRAGLGYGSGYNGLRGFY